MPSHWLGITWEGSNRLHDFPRMMCLCSCGTFSSHWAMKGFQKLPWKSTPPGCVILHRLEPLASHWRWGLWFSELTRRLCGRAINKMKTITESTKWFQRCVSPFLCSCLSCPEDQVKASQHWATAPAPVAWILCLCSSISTANTDLQSQMKMGCESKGKGLCFCASPWDPA